MMIFIRTLLCLFMPLGLFAVDPPTDDVASPMSKYLDKICDYAARLDSCGTNSTSYDEWVRTIFAVNGYDSARLESRNFPFFHGVIPDWRSLTDEQVDALHSAVMADIARLPSNQDIATGLLSSQIKRYHSTNTLSRFHAREEPLAYTLSHRTLLRQVLTHECFSINDAFASGFREGLVDALILDPSSVLLPLPPGLYLKKTTRYISSEERLDQPLLATIQRSEGLLAASEAPISFILIEGWRDESRQKYLYSKGASRLDGRVRRSKHQLGKAIDFFPASGWADERAFGLYQATLWFASATFNHDSSHGASWTKKIPCVATTFVDLGHFEL